MAARAVRADAQHAIGHSQVVVAGEAVRETLHIGLHRGVGQQVGADLRTVYGVRRYGRRRLAVDGPGCSKYEVVLAHIARQQLRKHTAVDGDDLRIGCHAPDEGVLPLIMNFLTDERLWKLSADGPSGGFQKRRGGAKNGARAHTLP